MSLRSGETRAATGRQQHWFRLADAVLLGFGRNHWIIL
jgi:hypothetical protein